MINFNKIYLRRLDMFEDKFEGRVPSFAICHLKDDARRLMAKDIYEARRKLRFIDCWTIFKHTESYAMWKVYSSSFGLAIETTARQLIELLPEHAQLIKIKYFNFKDENGATMYDIPVMADPSLGEENIAIGRNFSAIKSLEYEYEKEVRVLLPHKSELEFFGINIDMSKMINKIIISPYASKWFEELVIDLVKNRFNFNSVIVEKSFIKI